MGTRNLPGNKTVPGLNDLLYFNLVGKLCGLLQGCTFLERVLCRTEVCRQGRSRAESVGQCRGLRRRCTLQNSPSCRGIHIKTTQKDYNRTLWHKKTSVFVFDNLFWKILTQFHQIKSISISFHVSVFHILKQLYVKASKNVFHVFLSCTIEQNLTKLSDVIFLWPSS